MASFEDLGLRPELLRTLEDEDIERPTALQQAVIPALRRGTNVVARASAGAGKTLAYGLGVLDRLQQREAEGEDGEETTPLRLLVLVPTQETGERVALSLFPYAQAVGLSLTAAGGTWATALTDAEILVTPPADLLESVRSSAVKLEGVEAVVVDGAALIHELGDWEGVDTLLDHLPRDAQRVLVSAAFPEAVQDLVDRRVKRALSYPAESVLPEERQSPLEGGVGYVLVGERDKLDVLTRQLAQPEGERGAPPVIFCRNDERAAELAEQLSVRGFVVGAVDDTEADVAVVAADATREELLEEAGDELGQTLSYDVPADAETLQARHGGDTDAVVLVEARELPHLREVARQARMRARAVPLPVDRGATAARLNAFREELRRAIREEDLAAQMLVLEPLLDEFGALEVAAAATALLRHRRPAAPQAAPGATPAPAATAAAATPAAAARSTDAGPAPAPYARLYVGVGSRDEIRPGDLVGALAGEANIPGSKIGRIEIRDSFSIVEVPAELAEQVIRSVNGTTIKGRSARVDYDRGSDRSKRGAAPPRRQSRPGGGGPRGGSEGGGPRGGGPRGGGGGGARRIVRRPPREE